MRLVAFTLLSACTSLTPSQHYAAALAATTWDDAHGHCVAIRTEPARSDCLAAATEALGRPIADCADIKVDHWAQECRFQYAERTALTGDLADAFAACDGTPEYGRECSYHLIRQASHRVVDKSPDKITDPFGGADFARLTRAPDAERLFWKAYFRERLANGVLIDPTGCPTQACTDGAQDEISLHLPGVMRANAAFCEADPATVGGTIWRPTPTTNAWIEQWRLRPCVLNKAPPLAMQPSPAPPVR